MQCTHLLFRRGSADLDAAAAVDLAAEEYVGRRSRRNSLLGDDMQQAEHLAGAAGNAFEEARALLQHVPRNLDVVVTKAAGEVVQLLGRALGKSRELLTEHALDCFGAGT